MSQNKKNLPGWPLDIIAVLILLSGVLVCFQYITLNKFQILSPTLSFDFEGLLTILKGAVAIESVDVALAFLILAGFVTLCALEIKGQRFSLFLRKTFETERHTQIVLILASLVLVRFYLARGAFHWQSDLGSHVSYAWLSAWSFRHGEFPIWSNFFASGSPYLQFYGSLFFFLVGLTDLILEDVSLSIKWVLIGLHVFSGLGMYCFVRTLCGSRQAGFISGLAYVLCFWHTHQILIMGRLPLSAFYALLPWPFFFFERLRFPSRQIPAVIGGALTLGALPFAHPGYAFWGTALLTLYIGIRFLIARSTWPLKKLGKYALILVLGGLILGACLTLPMWLERAHVGLDVSGQDGHNTGLPSPTWKHLFYWSNYRLVLFSFSEQHWFGSYLGLSLILTACLGLIGMGVRHPRTSLLASGTVCLIGSLVLVFGHHLPAVRAIPAVQMLYPWRYLLFVSFFLSLMVGAGVTLVLPRLSKKQPYPYYTLLLLLILLDLGTTTFQHPYLPAQNEAGLTHMSSNLYQNLRDEASEFPDGALPNYRYFYLSDTNMSFLPNAWIPSQTGIPSAFNAYVEDPLAAHKFCMPLYDYLNPVFSRFKSPDDLQASEQLGVIAAGFYLLNIRHIFSFQSDIKQLFHWTWLYNSPIVVASQTAGWDLWKAQNNIALNQNPDLVTLLTQMGVNVLNHTCQRIFLDGQAPLQNLHTTPQVEVRSHQVWNQRVALTVHTSAPCFARLAYAHYPYLQVTVNGEFQDPLQTAGGFIALKLEGGTHKIVLEPYLSPLRRVLLILNAILILAATGLLIQFRRSKGRNSTRVPSPKETDCL